MHNLKCSLTHSYSDWWEGKFGINQVHLKSSIVPEDLQELDNIRQGNALVENLWDTDIADWIGLIIADVACSFAPHVTIYKITDVSRDNHTYDWKVATIFDSEGLVPENEKYPPFLVMNWHEHYDLLVYRVELQDDNLLSF
jgi:hypothetical protein